MRRTRAIATIVLGRRGIAVPSGGAFMGGSAKRLCAFQMGASLNPKFACYVPNRTKLCQ
ncbi:MAG: hypothetical protein DSM106950_07955 [Stigonema ocellatum SAG 48.90 = DSM 106950]|nr:hypothetical protein [Stigonema ocellatum SAG 48.90 = DSM 106950]